MQKVQALWESPQARRVQALCQTVAPFAVFLPYLAGWLTLLTSWLGPSLIKNDHLSLLRVTSLPGVHQNASESSGIFFGEFSSCFKINGSSLQCTPSSLTPNYQATLDAAVEAGLPKTLLNFLPDHLIQTPAVIVSGLVLMFVGLPLLAVSAVATWAPSLRLRIPLRTSNWIWCGGMFCLFWGWLLCLSISLAQQNQFDYFASTFSSVARVSTKSNTVKGFQHAELGGSFTQQWVGYAFLTLCLPLVYVQHLMWPESVDTGSGPYWIGAKA